MENKKEIIPCCNNCEHSCCEFWSRQRWVCAHIDDEWAFDLEKIDIKINDDIPHDHQYDMDGIDNESQWYILESKDVEKFCCPNWKEGIIIESWGSDVKKN